MLTVGEEAVADSQVFRFCNQCAKPTVEDFTAGQLCSKPNTKARPGKAALLLLKRQIRSHNPRLGGDTPLATTAGPSLCFFRSSCLHSAEKGESVSSVSTFFLFFQV
jgi:hypothetical protein